jgi:hypothetical protein
MNAIERAFRGELAKIAKMEIEDLRPPIVKSRPKDQDIKPPKRKGPVALIMGPKGGSEATKSMGKAMAAMGKRPVRFV